jgi:hypothetical protein
VNHILNGPVGGDPLAVLWHAYRPVAMLNRPQLPLSRGTQARYGAHRVWLGVQQSQGVPKG